ncbi:MAG: DnaD domain protein [Chloroflexi bacterium]|nr:DnaD domain protein [Chloroflexota bacterium]
MATDRPAPGFPPGVSFTPVPSPLLGHILAEISDPSELRVTLRFIWLASQKKGVPRPVSLEELVADRVIAGALGLTGDDLMDAVRRAVAGAVARGTLARLPSSDGVESYVLNTEPERRAIARLGVAGRSAEAAPGTRAAEPAPAVVDRPNIYVLYEQNIGPLTPMAGQLLNQAALSFPEEWIREAIQIAVANNARNWKYVSAILDRWATEGKPREQPGRDLQEDRLEPYRRAYGRYLKRR